MRCSRSEALAGGGGRELLNSETMSINQIGGPQDTPTAQRLTDWLRSNGWTVSTEHRGEMRIGGRTVSQDKSVAAFALDLLDEFSGVGNRMY